MKILARSTWRLDLLAVTAVVVLFYESAQFSVCRCWYGTWARAAGNAAFLIWTIVVARYVLAWVFAEKNTGWKYYLALLAVSPFLVKAAFAMALTTLPLEMRIHP